jgi:exodeoxyribonuclease-3
MTKPTRLLSWNLNGIRAALRKGLDTFLTDLDPDIAMLQEVRAFKEQIPTPWDAPPDWHVHWHPAEKKGYSGTATWSRQPQVLHGTGLNAADPEGRLLHTEVKGLHLVNLYLPSGSSGPEKQLKKDHWMANFLPWSMPFVDMTQPVVIAGDFNIAHTDMDIHNPSGNKKNSGFLPHERSWFTELLNAGWVDVMRVQAGPGKGPYSWWSNRGRARELDRGWRIDYFLCNAAAAERVVNVATHRAGGLTVSDHAPLTLDLDLP